MKFLSYVYGIERLENTMYENYVVRSNYKVYGIANMYKGFSSADLILEIYEYGDDAVEFKLINANYNRQKNLLKKQFICFNFCCVIYSIFIFKDIHFVNIDIFLILWIMVLLCRLGHLVESENVFACSDFGLHLQTQKFLGKQNRYIAVRNIHDVVINEVLEDLDFRYLLILRTKGILFNKTPIICIFKEFKPSYECLTLVYKRLNKVIKMKNV